MTSSIATSSKNFMQSVGQLGAQLTKGAEHVVADFIDSTTDDVKAFGKAAAKGDVLGAAAAFLDGVSTGRMLEKGLGAVGMLPDRPTVAGNAVSALVNLATANPVAAVVDIEQALALSKAPTSGATQAAKPHSVERPSHEAKRHVENGRWASSTLDGSARTAKCLLADIRHDSSKLSGRLDAIVHSPVATKAPADVKIALPPDVRGAVEHPARDGAPVQGRPVSEVGYDEILNDPTLCFEDMLALFMMKFGSDMRAEITAQAREMAKVNDKLKALPADGKGGSAAATTNGEGASEGKASAGKTSEGKPSEGKASEGDFIGMLTSGVAGAVKGFMTADNLKGLTSGALDVASMLAPVVLPTVLGAIGTACPVLGNIIGAVGGEALAQLAVGAMQVLKGAVQSGAFDGLFQAAQDNPSAALGIGGTTAVFACPLAAPALVALSAVMALDEGKATRSAPAPTSAATGGTATGATGRVAQQAASTDGLPDDKASLQDSREQMAEKLKLLNDRLNEFTQTMSNIMNSQHQTAMNAIGNIR